MKGFALFPALAWFLILFGGGISLLCNSGWINPSITPDLALLETQIGPFARDFEIEVDPELLGDLPPERFTFQNIIGPNGQYGRLYIAYYSRGRRWSGRPHDLQVCYRAMGYTELEVDSLKTESGAVLWSRIFQRGNQTVKVIHWLQKPGRLPKEEGVSDHLQRILTKNGLRQDVASIYFEFDLADAPSDEAFIAASDDLISQVEALWE
ncbi:MAG: exosortase-associated EpsI family protein [Planctomycetota bacterium]